MTSNGDTQTSNVFLLKFATTITYEDSEENIIFDDNLVSEELNKFFRMQQKL